MSKVDGDRVRLEEGAVGRRDRRNLADWVDLQEVRGLVVCAHLQHKW